MPVHRTLFLVVRLFFKRLYQMQQQLFRPSPTRTTQHHLQAHRSFPVFQHVDIVRSQRSMCASDVLFAQARTILATTGWKGHTHTLHVTV